MNRLELKSESPHGAMTAVAIDGHQIRAAVRVALEVDVADVTVATIKFLPMDGMDINMWARVLLDEPTRQALIELGWTPPKDA